MHLIKYCKPEHNVFKGAKLRVGTLYEYRDIENPEIADAEEGKYTFTIEFPDRIELSHAWANLVFRGAMSFSDVQTVQYPGSTIAKIDKINIIENLRASVVLIDTAVTITREVPNCLIFCMSQNEIDAPSPFDGYTDRWSIQAGSADEFANRLGQLIFRQADLSIFSENLLSNFTADSIKRLGYHGVHRPVIYSNRNISITKENMPPFEQMNEILANIQFIKPEKFAAEKEYRFLFNLTNGVRIFAPKKQAVFMDLNPFTGI